VTIGVPTKRISNIPLLLQALNQDRALDMVSFSENDVCRLLNRFRQNIISSENSLGTCIDYQISFGFGLVLTLIVGVYTS
jgi:hypothetical protein